MNYELPSRGAKKSKQRDEISRIVSCTRDDPVTENVVYVLECRTPENEAELRKYKKNANVFVEYSKYDIKSLIAEKVYYVGWTNRPVGRIFDHLRAENEGAYFTKVYQPISIEEIRWFETKEAAKQAEGSVAGEYNNFGGSDMSVDLSAIETSGQVVEWSDIVAEIDQYDHPRSFAYSM